VQQKYIEMIRWHNVHIESRQAAQTLQKQIAPCFLGIGVVNGNASDSNLRMIFSISCKAKTG
jgi:hypothetical protein